MAKRANLTAQHSHNYLLDGYRIVAILMVLSVHIRGYLEGTPAIVKRILGLGAYGVALYFILSGYFSYSSVIKEAKMINYAKKKAIRILPMYYVSLLLTFIVGVFITGEYPLDLKWLYHVFFFNMFVPSKNWEWWNSVNFFWTMPAFIAWYVLSPVLFKYMKNSNRMAIATLITVVLSPFLKNWMYTFASEQFVNWNFLCLLYVFLFGVLAYFLVKEHNQIKGAIYGIVITAAGWIIGNRSGFLAFGFVFFLMILVASIFPIRWSNHKLNHTIKWLSASTYSVYLTHWFVLQFLGESIGKMPWIIDYIYSETILSGQPKKRRLPPSYFSGVLSGSAERLMRQLQALPSQALLIF